MVNFKKFFYCELNLIWANLKLRNGTSYYVDGPILDISKIILLVYWVDLEMLSGYLENNKHEAVKYT